MVRIVGEHDMDDLIRDLSSEFKKDYDKLITYHFNHL